jgi:hypothetical protein
MAKIVKATGGHPPVYTGKGTDGTGLGYHGKPRGATTPAKGMGYHGKPPSSVTGGQRHPNDAAAKGPVGGHTMHHTSSSGQVPKPMPKRGPK